MLISVKRCGAHLVLDIEAGAVPGHLPRKGPTPITGGPSQISRGARGQEDRAITQTKQRLKIVHWTAEVSTAKMIQNQAGKHTDLRTS